ncbi:PLASMODESMATA CALLOSE-BINDING PROTEIN 5-like [Aristolochia californica]|uniref:PLASMODESMATA CALLOSE-BINDING PROTEIN 5-like n=1 Tax=Aristolochia californica TaxID=171875 RepID=UPI0035D704DF
MASFSPLLRLSFILIIISSSLRLNNGEERRGLVEYSKADNGGEKAQQQQQLWCVAKNNAEDGALQAAIDWACGPGGADCGAIQQGGDCFEPQDIQSHASYAFNDYFLKHGLDPQACVFNGAAAVTVLNPSQGKCILQSGSSVKNSNFTGSSQSVGGTSEPDLSSAFNRGGWVRPLTIALLTYTARWIIQ